jgi:signal transduction histidine kinase
MKQLFSPSSDTKAPASQEVVIPVLIVSAISALVLAFMDINRIQMVVVSIIFFLTLLLAYRGYFIFARWISLLSALVIISSLFYQNYGIRDTAALGLVVVIISAGLLTGRTGTMVIGALILGEVVIFGFLESLGVINNKFSASNNFTDYLTSGIAILLVTILQSLTISLLNKNITKAKQELEERIKTEAQLQKRLVELNAVSGVSKTLITKTNLRNLIEDTGEQMRLAFNASNLFIAIHDPLTNLIHFPYDYKDDKKQADLPLKFGEGMTSKIIEMKKTILINRDWSTIAAQYNVIHRSTKPVKSSLAAPIIIRDKAIGIISMDNTEHEDAFTENDIRLLETITANLAVAIDNTYLQESLKRDLVIQGDLILELETKNAELERFTYTASHDLKSPLITIRGYLGYLEKDAYAGNFERLKTDIQRIAEATDKMHRLLSELLELSRIGRVVNEPQETPFEEIVREALQRVEGQLTERQIKVEVGSSLPVVFGDKERLVEVVQNFVDNACKFTKEQAQPMIQIGFEEKDNENIFFIKDNGIGIRKEYHEKIFGLFDKLDPASDGTGIGLALAKRIIEVHGGRVWVESDGQNKGTTFFFTLSNQK